MLKPGKIRLPTSEGWSKNRLQMSSLQALLGKFKKTGDSVASDKRPRPSDGGNGAPKAKKMAVARPATSVVLSEEDREQIGYCDPALSSFGDLAQIGRRCKTDKVSHHGYYRFYPRFLEHLRPKAISGGKGMIEIGIDESHSLKTWLEYFPDSFVYGIDIGVELDGPRHRIFKADQSNRSQLENIVQKRLKHDIFFIIDDGSHVPEHQILSFDYMFDACLKPGGTYIIEDIETSYWTKNGLYGYDTRYGYHHAKSCIEAFKELADDVNSEFLTSDNRREHEKRVGSRISAKTRAEVSSVTFGMNCIVITKKTKEEHALFDNRAYRFRKNI